MPDPNGNDGHQGRHKKPDKNEGNKKSNIITALNQAINEFAESGATAVKLNAPVNNVENQRLIAVFTNNFDIETNKNEL